MSTLKTHNLQSPDAGSVNIAMTPNAGMVVTGISTFTGASIHVGLSQFQNTINLTHASAGQNYIYFNEDLQFAKNGTGTRLKIDSSGNVLIGTTTEAGKLTVDSGTSNTCATFKSTDVGAGINLVDTNARSSIEQNGTTLKISSDSDAF